MQFIASSIFSMSMPMKSSISALTRRGLYGYVLDGELKYIFVFIQIKYFYTNCISDLFVNELLLVINKISIDILEKYVIMIYIKINDH